MKDIAIAIAVGSPNSTEYLVKQTFDSIRDNIGNCDWKIFIGLGVKVKFEVKKIVLKYVEDYPTNFELLLHEEVSWATFINKAIDASEEYRYFIKSHDDIKLMTSDFYTKVTQKLKEINKPVGWVSFTDIGWMKGDFSPAVRVGYHIDVLKEKAWEERRVFQFHLFPKYWTRAGIFEDLLFKVVNRITSMWKKTSLPYPKPTKKIAKYSLDLPKAPVRCHAPFNHFVLIEMEVLKRIGKCEDWNTYNALFVDEDWGLRALQLNIPNIWIPDIIYFHYRGENRGGGTRSNDSIISENVRVGKLFYNKWGFNTVPSPEELVIIRNKYRDTLIPWSSYRKSFEWDYQI